MFETGSGSFFMPILIVLPYRDCKTLTKSSSFAIVSLYHRYNTALSPLKHRKIAYVGAMAGWKYYGSIKEAREREMGVNRESQVLLDNNKKDIKSRKGI